MREDESDATLWLEAVSGTERAFVVIFDRYRTRVFRAAYRRVLDVTQAEDAVAIVFLEAWRLRKRVRIVDGSLLPWLLAVTTHVTSNLSRSQRRYARMVAQLPSPDQHENPFVDVDERIDGHDRRRTVAAAIMSLAPRDRAVVELCLVEELPLADAAAALDLPLGTVKSRLHRARAQLRTKLEAADISMQSLAPNNPEEGSLT
ncbi:RNA polymerase sigma factor [Microbacterium sp. NPDC089189]|uniref:RNA polymerase sigma factor n=1 Tax=Microbacterium sp. NPDC089189 TaxID=3154972 RepID=UPI00341ED5EE